MGGRLPRSAAPALVACGFNCATAADAGRGAERKTGGLACRPAAAERRRWEMKQRILPGAALRAQRWREGMSKATLALRPSARQLIFLALASISAVLSPSVGRGSDRIIFAGDHSLTVVDATTGETVRTIPTGFEGFKGPCGVAISGPYVYTLLRCGGGEVGVFDIEAGASVDTIHLPCCATSIGASPNGDTILVLLEHGAEKAVATIDPETNSVQRTDAVGVNGIVTDMAAATASKVANPGTAPSSSGGCSVMGDSGAAWGVLLTYILAAGAAAFRCGRLRAGVRLVAAGAVHSAVIGGAR